MKQVSNRGHQLRGGTSTVPSPPGVLATVGIAQPQKLGRLSPMSSNVSWGWMIGEMMLLKALPWEAHPCSYGWRDEQGTRSSPQGAALPVPQWQQQ